MAEWISKEGRKISSTTVLLYVVLKNGLTMSPRLSLNSWAHVILYTQLPKYLRL